MTISHPPHPVDKRCLRRLPCTCLSLPLSLPCRLASVLGLIACLSLSHECVDVCLQAARHRAEEERVAVERAQRALAPRSSSPRSQAHQGLRGGDGEDSLPETLSVSSSSVGQDPDSPAPDRSAALAMGVWGNNCVACCVARQKGFHVCIACGRERLVCITCGRERLVCIACGRERSRRDWSIEARPRRLNPRWASTF